MSDVDRHDGRQAGAGSRDDGPYTSAEQAQRALFATPFGLDGTYAQIEVAVGSALDEAGLRDSMTAYEQYATTRLARMAVAAGEPELLQPFVAWIRRRPDTE